MPGLVENWLNKLSNVTTGFTYTGGVPGTGTETDPLQMAEVGVSAKKNTMENNGGILNASIWQSLFGNADDIIAAIKTNPNQQPWYNNGAVVLPGSNTGISPVVIIGGVLLIIVIIIIAVMAGRKK